MSDVKKFWLSFFLIVGASVAMHVFVFSKHVARTQHYEPSFTRPIGADEAFVPQGPPVEGTVSALGSDRFYVESSGRRWGFLYPTEGRPALNARVRVYYYQGHPPAAVRVESL